jgi:preprotein translocase subunit SecE
VARNRKRRNDRRPRRSADEPSTRPGVATARGQRPEPAPAPEPVEPVDGASVERPPVEGSTDPLEHAAPDVELAEAQLAVGRAQAGAADASGAQSADDDEEFEDEVELAEAQEAARTQLSSRGETAPSPRLASRLVHFLQGSWRELQRVQWPDRRQVMQATGVVIGFVIVAGVFLGVADWAAQKIVTFILK